MKLKYLLLCFTCVAFTAQAQDFSDMEWKNELGYELAVTIPTSANVSGPGVLVNGIAYKPSYDYPIGDDMSVGLTAPISIGLDNGASYMSFSYALAGQFSAGLGSTNVSSAPFGAFISWGAGSYDLYPLMGGEDTWNYYGAYFEFGFRVYYYGTPTTLSIGGFNNVNPSMGDIRMTTLRMLYNMSY